MSKHVIDGPKSSASRQAAERFARIEGNRMPRPQTLKMQKRTRTASAGARLRQFVAIDRRQNA